MYYVSGNHESLSDAYPDFRTKLEALGVHVLDDRYVTLRKGEDAVCLVGVDDPVMAKEWIDDDLAMEKHIAAMDLPSDLFTILLSHRPELLQVYAQYGIDLVFSGHAHGGQIRLPFIGGLFAPCQGLLPRYTSGIYTIEYTQMVVSRGIGNSVFPFRVHNRPELVFITLSKS